MSNFAQNRRNTNVMNMSAPHRFDSEVSSCVNNGVKVFNRKLQKKIKIFNHTEIIDISSNGEHYRKYGLHMNVMVKKGLTNKRAN
jgi:hypothetical protein